MTVQPSRRDLILAAVGAAIASAGAAGFPATLFAQSAVTPEQFLALSEKLTATPNLDIGIATAILGGFLATGHGDEIAKMVAEGYDFFTPLANAIVAAWYSGVYTTMPKDDGASPPNVPVQESRGLHTGAPLECADLHQTVGRMRRRDRLLGRSAGSVRANDGRRYHCGRHHRWLGHLRCDHGVEACRGGCEGCDPRGGGEGRPAGRGGEILECGDQGAGMPLPACAAGHASDLERPRLLVPAGRAGQVREHLHQGRRRHDVALARHVPPSPPQRFPAEVALRPGRRLADLL